MITREVDAYLYSHYFYKQKDSDGGLLVNGPPWDYNLAFGNNDYYEDVHLTYNWIYTQDNRVYWWNRVMEDGWFRNQLRCRWDELYQTVLSRENQFPAITSAGLYWVPISGPTPSWDKLTVRKSGSCHAGRVGL